ncbi:MAG: type II toxin-antitoxin system PemK/MazF family toxin [Waltera sp.]
MCKRGDIYYVDFGEKDGSKQGGVRPALVVSNNKANKHSRWLRSFRRQPGCGKEVSSDPRRFPKAAV